MFLGSIMGGYPADSPPEVDSPWVLLCTCSPVCSEQGGMWIGLVSSKSSICGSPGMGSHSLLSATSGHKTFGWHSVGLSGSWDTTVTEDYLSQTMKSPSPGLER